MAFAVRNTQWSGVDAQMINATTGASFTGTVTCYVDGDDTGQVLGQTSAGICTAAGNGVYTYVPVVAETNYNKITFTFVAAGAVSVSKEIATITPAQQQTLAVTSATGSIAVNTLVRHALRRINIIQAGQTNVDGSYLTDAFALLNLMMDAWQAEKLTKPYLQATYANLDSTHGTPTNPYTIGVGGLFNVARPTEIHHMNFQDNSQNPPLERPLTPLTRDAYVAIQLKTLTNTLPGAFYYQPTYANNLGSIYLWMIPTQANLQGVVYTLAAVPQFGTLNDTVVLPPGYVFAIIDNLALILAAQFRENLPPDPLLVQSAATLKANLKRINIELMDLSVDPALTTQRGVYNILSDSVTGRP